jgi:hypothetical protein
VLAAAGVAPVVESCNGAANTGIYACNRWQCSRWGYAGATGRRGLGLGTGCPPTPIQRVALARPALPHGRGVAPCRGCYRGLNGQLAAPNAKRPGWVCRAA